MCETKTAVNMEMSRPMISVTAKPLTGPVPNCNRKSAEMIVVAWVSTIVAKAFEKPFSIAALRGPAVAQLLADALEDEHVRVDRHADRQDEAGDAGQRQRRLEERHRRREQEGVQDEREDRVPAGAPVVDDHRDEDEQRSGDGGRDALADRVEPERRADGPLLEVRQARRQRARAQDERQVVGLLRRERALDDARVGDPVLDARAPTARACRGRSPGACRCWRPWPRRTSGTRRGQEERDRMASRTGPASAGRSSGRGR